MWVSHFIYICLLRCEGEFYSPCLAKVPDTEWMPNVCLFSEWMKTEKTMKNIQRAVSSGEQIWVTQSKDGDSPGQQILIAVGERGSSGRGCLPALLLQPVQTLRPWSGNTWLANGNPPKEVNFCLRVSHRTLSIMPPVLKSLLDPTFLILCYSPCPTVCPRTWGVFFISCFRGFRLQPTSLHFGVAAL